MQSISRSGDIHEQAKAMMGQTAQDPSQHNFFAPLNEMDPHTRKKKPIPLPKFNFHVFYLSGADSVLITEDTEKYMLIMKKVTEGDYQLLDEQTYHTKEGEIKVFLKWLELPLTKEVVPEKKSFDKAFDEMVEGKQAKTKKKKKNKKKSTKPNPQLMV
jgi:hypothetical protein